jgi:hypothetical protein
MAGEETEVQNPADTNEEKLVASVATMAREFAKKCEFTRGDETTALLLNPAPVLRWSNPTVGKVYGEVYLWTDNGRPVVVASLYRWFQPNWGRTLEVTLLDAEHLIGRMDDVRFWVPSTTGVTFKSLKGVDPPAKAEAARLIQMRRLAGEFSANLVDRRGAGTTGVTRQLRLLTKPVFRYPAPNDNSSYSDGALFAFVEGTDPEALLLLEATKSDSEARWQYGLARMNSDELQVTFRGEIVWTAPGLKQSVGRPREPYAAFSLDRPQRDISPNVKPGHLPEAKP